RGAPRDLDRRAARARRARDPRRHPRARPQLASPAGRAAHRDRRGADRSRVVMLSAHGRDHLVATVRGWSRPRPTGKVIEIAGTLVQIEMTGASLGDIVEIAGAGSAVRCEVVGFRGPMLLAIPLTVARRIAPGASVRHLGALAGLPVGDALIGRLVDPFGAPLDGGGPPPCTSRARVETHTAPG